MKKLHPLAKGVSTAALICLATPAYAQVNEIIVTAEKRETNIQQTPIAMSALGGEELEARQINDVEALLGALPNVDFGSQLGNARLAIRGIGFDNITGGNEGRIAYHQDGVYYSRPFSVSPGFFDVERIEVLRGPQGTLYGRNATGGVVNVITRDPGEELNGDLSVAVGNYEAVTLNGAIGGPISDSLGVRFAFQSQTHGGYGDNEITGEDVVDDLNIYGLRGKVQFNPTNDFSATLTADYAFQKDHANAYVNGGTLPFATVPAGTPGAVFGPQAQLGVQFGGVFPRELRNSTGDVTRNRRELSGVSLDVDYTIGALNFTSITAWRSAEYRVTGDADMTSAPILAIDQFEESDQFSEEFRVSHTGDSWDWMLGAYYFKEEVAAGNRFPGNLRGALPFYRPATPATACTNFVTRFPCSLVPLDPRGYSTMYRPEGTIDTDAWAVFGNVHFQVTPKFGARLGLRYSEETKDTFNQQVFELFAFNGYPNPGFVPFPVNIAACTAAVCLQQIASKNYTSLTPSLTLDYRASDDIYFYATYSEGFKSGGFNVGNTQPAFDPEQIIDYEVGVKADWMGGRLRTNVSAFYYDYSDIQATLLKINPPPPPGAVQILNSPGAEQYGVEFEGSYYPTDNLKFDLSFALMHSEYSDGFLGANQLLPAASGFPVEVNNGGNQLIYAPDRTLNAGAQYTWPVDRMKITLRGEAEYKDQVFFTIFNEDYLSQPEYWRYNAFLTLASEGGWDIQLFGRNLSDETVFSASQVGALFIGGSITSAIAPPRTFGLQLGYSF